MLRAKLDLETWFIFFLSSYSKEKYINKGSLNLLLFESLQKSSKWKSMLFNLLVTLRNYNWYRIVFHFVVMGRVYPNPKTRRVLVQFCKPEATRTRIFHNLISPKLPEPKLFNISKTRSYPNPKSKPEGTR